jgi:hypothetical protein
MCEFSGKLVAWMDRELSDDEAANVEQHVRECSECRECVGAYEWVSREVVAYCDVTAKTIETRRQSPHWVPLLSSAAAAVALFIVFVSQTTAFRPASIKNTRPTPQVADASPIAVREATPGAIEKVHRRHLNAPAKIPSATWVSAQPAIQISIPAEAMFPPGAVPEGTVFIADMRMAADGSLQGLRLQ